MSDKNGSGYTGLNQEEVNKPSQTGEMPSSKKGPYRFKHSYRTIVLCTAAVLLAIFVYWLISGTPNASYPPPTSEAELMGSFEGNTYKNGYLGYDLTVPLGWTILNNEQIASLQAQTQDVTGEELKQKIKEQKISVFFFKYPVDYAQGYNPNVNIVIKQVNGISSKKPLDIAQNMKKQLDSQLPDTAKTAGTGTTNGSGFEIPYVDIEITMYGVLIEERQYYLPRKDYISIITCAYQTPLELSELESVIKTITLK